MALTKTGAGIVELSGKFAGNVFKRDASGQHTQSFPRIVKRNASAGQRLQRNSWRTCSNYWHNAISEHNRELWHNYAALHPIKNKQGQPITLFGYQYFLLINMVRVHNELDILPTPPS